MTLSTLVTISCAAAKQGADWFELVPAGLGAVLGAILGAVPTFFLARRSAADVLKRDQEARHEQRKLAGFRAQIKMSEIVNDLYTYEHMFADMLKEKSGKEFNKMLTWQKIKPITGVSYSDTVRFDAEELVVFMEAGNPQFVNDLLLLGKQHETVIGSLVKYAELRYELMLSLPASVSGQIGTAFMTGEQLERFMPRSVLLETLITQLISQTKEYSDRARTLARRFGPILNNFLPGSNFGFSFDDESKAP